MGRRKEYLTSRQIADLLMVSTESIRLWANNGELVATQTPGGHRRFLYHDVESFARSKNIDINIVRRDKIKILIVDDDALFCDLLKTVITMDSDKFMIEISHDGFDAGTQLRSFFPDIVLLDLNMPGLNGLQVCQRIKDDFKDQKIRVIAITGHRTLENERMILEAGAEVCLEKPISNSTLLKLLNQQ